MRQLLIWPLKFRPLLPNISASQLLLLAFCMVMLMVFIADGAMSYLSPVIIEEATNSLSTMGFILGSSSIAGLLCDFLFPQWFRGKNMVFMIRGLLLTMIMFPLSYLFLPRVAPSFLVSMAIWGIYYEFLRFSEFSFVRLHLAPGEHAKAWGFLETFRSLGLLIGPLAAEFFLDLDPKQELPFWLVVVFILLAATLFRLIRFTNKSIGKQAEPLSKARATEFKGSPKTEIHIWLVLIKKLWPLYLLFWSLVLLDTAFWSVGTLLTEELGNHHSLGHFFLAAYSLPSILFSLFAARLAKPWGKKRMAFITAILAGLILSVMMWFGSGNWLVLAVFASSSFIAIAYPELFAVFEDYTSRLGKWGHDLIGLQATAANTAYIVGPMIAGLLATQFGTQRTMSLFALWLLVTAAIALIFVPRKIRMPQQVLVEIWLAHEKHHRRMLRQKKVHA